MNCNNTDNNNNQKNIIEKMRVLENIDEEQCIQKLKDNIYLANSFNQNTYTAKSILDEKGIFCISKESRRIKSYLDQYFPRVQYENAIACILTKKEKGKNIQEEIIQMKRELLEKDQQIKDLINITKDLKRKYENINCELMETKRKLIYFKNDHKNNNNNTNNKELIKNENNNDNNDKEKANNNNISISHCSQITINNHYNNNQNIHLIQNWFETKIEKTDNEKDYEPIDCVLTSCIQHIGTIISSKKLGNEMRHRFGIAAPRKRQQEDGSRPYCYIGIRLRKKFNIKNKEIE